VANHIHIYIFSIYRGVDQKGGLVGLGAIGTICSSDGESHAVTQVLNIFQSSQISQEYFGMKYFGMNNRGD